MGCAQASSTVPEETTSSARRLPPPSSDSGIQTLPVVKIIVDSAPFHVKGVLKKPPTTERTQENRTSLDKRHSLAMQRSVNFDRQIRVKSRTPTPSLIPDENSLSDGAMTRLGSTDDLTSLRSEDQEEQQRRRRRHEELTSKSPRAFLETPHSLFQHDRSVLHLRATHSEDLIRSSIDGIPTRAALPILRCPEYR